MTRQVCKKGRFKEPFVRPERTWKGDTAGLAGSLDLSEATVGYQNRQGRLPFSSEIMR